MASADSVPANDPPGTGGSSPPPTSGPEGPGYHASQDQLLRRLRRVEGQIRGVARMVEDERYCIDVLTQISAAQAALDKVALGLLDAHTRHCVVGGHGPGTVEERSDELMAAVGRLLGRG